MIKYIALSILIVLAFSKLSNGDLINIDTKPSESDSNSICLTTGTGDGLLSALNGNKTAFAEWKLYLDSNGCYPKKFTPEANFKPILPNQQIDPGLYIRIDFSTGLKWAKLSPNDDGLAGDGTVAVEADDSKALVNVPQNDTKADHEPVKEKNFHYEKTLQSNKSDQLPGKRISRSQKSEYLQLFSELQSCFEYGSPLNITTRTEIILEAINQVSHHVDYGILFLQVGNGWDLLLNITANDKVPLEMRRQAAVIAGNLVQNNAPVAEKAIESLVMERLAEVLDTLLPENSAADDSVEGTARLVSAVLYALAALARHSSAAFENCLAGPSLRLPRVWHYGMKVRMNLLRLSANDEAEKPVGLSFEKIANLVHVAEHISTRVQNLVVDWAAMGWLTPYTRGILLGQWCTQLYVSKESLSNLPGGGHALYLPFKEAKQSVYRILHAISGDFANGADGDALSSVSDSALDELNSEICVLHWNSQPAPTGRHDEL